MRLNETLGIERSYYAASANPYEPAPRLTGSATADLCIIGGGCTGLSAALHARQRGYSVVLLEGGRIGWGASGRNGGQMIPGLRKSAPELIRMLGRERAKSLFSLAIEARDLVVDLIYKHEIACDLRLTGHLQAAMHPREMAAMEAELRCLEDEFDYPRMTLLDAEATRAELASPLYHGSLIDDYAGHMHPMNYTIGLAQAAREAGAEIHEHSAAIRIDGQAPFRVATADGEVTAPYLLLACDAFLGALDLPLAGKIMPVGSYLVATEPLSPEQVLISKNRAVSDNKFVVDYFRMSADNRLIFAGGERYTPSPPPDIAAFVRPYMLEVFPQLADAAIDYAWGGLVSVTRTRLPDIGRRGNLFYAHGYSGKGVILTTLCGSLIAEAIAGTAERFDIMASVAPPAFPGGTRFRYPLYVLAMLWYAMRDRL